MNPVAKCNVTGYDIYQVQIRNFIHKGLKRLYEEDSKKGVPPDSVDKLRKMLAFLDDMEDRTNYGLCLHGEPIFSSGTVKEPGVCRLPVIYG